LGTYIPEFTVFGEKMGDEVIHTWYIGSDDFKDSDKLAGVLDEILSAKNDDYAAVRKRSLQKPKVQLVASHLFSDYLSKKVQRSGQTKFPRVLKAHQIEDWLNFIGKV
jgi:hypothetical protein